jgi:hypothetical protein
MANCCRDLKTKNIMNINYELIALLVVCAFIIGCIVIHELRLEKKDLNYKKYLDSIKVGDTFEFSFVKDLSEDPFSSDYLNHKKYQCVITDIKKNTKGETWVKYKNLSNGEEKTEEIYIFAEHRNKI